MRAKEKKLPIRVVAPAITKAMMDYYEFEDPDDINWGTCYYWAFVAHQFCGGKLVSLNAHAFIKIRNRYYDSVAHKGAKSIEDLLFFGDAGEVKIQDETEILSPENFKQKWSSIGAYGWSDFDISKIVSRVKKNLESSNNSE